MPSGCRLQDASNTLGHVGGRRHVWSHWYSDPNLSNSPAGKGDAMYETLTTLFWNDRMREFHDVRARARVDGGVRSISDFMSRLEMPERAAAKQPPGLAVELRGTSSSRWTACWS